MAHECNECGVPLGGMDSCDGVCGNCYKRIEGRPLGKVLTLPKVKMTGEEVFTLYVRCGLSLQGGQAGYDWKAQSDFRKAAWNQFAEELNKEPNEQPNQPAVQHCAIAPSEAVPYDRRTGRQT